jgi:perosamine synthetase
MTDPPRRIRVAAPALAGNERAYVLDCVESGWISSIGSYVDRFEQAFAEACECEHAVSCCNGTAALHLALLGLGVGAGDEVIVPTLTFVSTANAVVYTGARPVFADVDPETWAIDAASVEAAVTSRTVGVIAVHLYGQPADMEALQRVADRHGLFVLEDAAEAHGARYGSRAAGSLGSAATFSFYGNKIITTGEGGMVTTNDARLAQCARQLRGQGLDPTRRYWFPVIGYNYRLTNIAAAIGLAQLEQLDWNLDRRRTVARLYRELLGADGRLTFQAEQPGTVHSHWMVTLLLSSNGPGRDEVARRLDSAGIETRPAFVPMHVLPPYQDGTAGEFPNAERVGALGLSLPTHARLTDEDVQFVSRALVQALDEG